MNTRNASRIFSLVMTLAVVIFSLAVSAWAQAETVLLSFSGTGGEGVYSPPIFDSTGHLYGTTENGGNLTACQNQGCGVVWKATRTTGTAWKETVIHTFSGGRDGANPEAGLVQDAAGNLYGVTYHGGVTCSYNADITCGVAFRLSIGSGGGWKETVLHVFTGGTDGGQPAGSLIVDSAGNLYGVAHAGGNAADCPASGQTGCGVVYRISPGSNGGWIETPLYSFNSSTDGAYPTGSLVLDSAGNLYGATSYLGPGGLGSIFELSPTSSGPWNFTLLHGFTGAPDASSPAGGLIFDASGNLYGATATGGTGGGLGPGTVYELSPGSGGTWTESILYNFQSPPDGEDPLSGVTFDAKGNLWGTTSFGGTLKHEYGTVYELSPGSGGWTEKVVHAFSGGNGDGQYPYAAVVFDKAGNLYGTTFFGGASKTGSLFEITP